MGVAGMFVAAGTSPQFVHENGAWPGILVAAIFLSINVLFVTRGEIAGLAVLSLSIAAAGAGAISNAISGMGPGAIAVSGAVTVAGAVVLAVGGAIVTSIAGGRLGLRLVGIGVVAGFSLIAALAQSGRLFGPFRISGFPQVSIMLLAVLVQIISALLIHRRALADNPLYAITREIGLGLGCVGGTLLAGADLSDAHLSGAHLAGSDLGDARLYRCRLYGVVGIEWARFAAGVLRSRGVQRLLVTGQGKYIDFKQVSLSGLHLAGAVLRGARLDRCNLSDTMLSGADLRDSSLQDADLRGAALNRSLLDGADLRGARIDAQTYQRSDWSPNSLLELHRRGVEIVALDVFPQGAQEALVGRREGLTLCFSTLLSALDKLLVEGLIVGVLGRDTEVHVAEYRTLSESAIVRICGPDRAELERVAEALYQRVWEQTMTQQTALVRLFEIIQPLHLRQGLQHLAARVERIELWGAQQRGPRDGSPSISGKDARPAERAEPRWIWHHPASGRDLIDVERPRRLFLCHAGRDQGLAEELVIHLGMLIAQGLVETFKPGDILPGAPHAEALSHLMEADVVVALVSADLFTDLDCMAQIQRAQASGKPLVPVLVRAVAWEDCVLSTLQCLPEDRRPVLAAPDRDQAWANVASGIRRLLLSLSTSASLGAHGQEERPLPTSGLARADE